MGRVAGVCASGVAELLCIAERISMSAARMGTGIASGGEGDSGAGVAAGSEGRAGYDSFVDSAIGVRYCC